ncbi:hypothetical protein [Pseudanabaena sp. PCC 6802]|uniref:hypothetical protein n=1 Tax=Pseudanabaena sp. PCC 6802 TaxID=118173 RepID=UPI00034BA6E0|nr:hypothetical protein [Pseudanabaena sp. PCC 6802]
MLLNGSHIAKSFPKSPKIHHSDRKIGFIVLTSVLLSIGGCGIQDIIAVQNFAAISAKSTEKFPILASDFYKSCLRAAILDSETIPTRKEREERCAKFKQLEPGLIATHRVVEAYMLALGTLASDKTIDFASEFANLGTQVKTLNVLKPAQTDAITGILNFLASAATDGYRREKLKDAIQISNTNLQITLEALKSIIGEDYKRLIKIESDTIDDYYKQKILELKDKDPVAALALRNQWKEQSEIIDKKLSAADDYVEILNEIGKAHQQLYDNRNTLDSEKMIQTMVGYSRRLQPLIEDFVKAFS